MLNLALMRTVCSVAFVPNGSNLLASASEDASILVTKCGSGNNQCSEHKDTVTGLAWHPTAPARLVSVGWDAQVCLRDVPVE